MINNIEELIETTKAPSSRAIRYEPIMPQGMTPMIPLYDPSGIQMRNVHGFGTTQVICIPMEHQLSKETIIALKQTGPKAPETDVPEDEIL